MFQLEAPNKVGVESRQHAQAAFSNLRHAVEAKFDPKQWLLTHDPVVAAVWTLRNSSVARSNVPVGKWVDRHIYHVLGMGGWARAILGMLTWDDVCKLGPNPKPTQAGYSTSGETAAAQAAAMTLNACLISAETEESEVVNQYQGASSGASSSKVTKLDVDHKYTNLADDLAQRLQAGQRTQWQHDDCGSRIGSGTLAAWTAGASITPLVESVNARGKIAVSMLVDVSGSTDYMGTELWSLACAMRNALIRAGHAAAVDRWDSDNHTKEDVQSYYSPVTVNWTEPETWIHHKSDGGTCLSDSATPAMGRLQSSAPAGMRQLCIVITDGATTDTDRAQFLRLAACPCVYVTVDHNANQQELEEEGWACVIQVQSTGMADVVGDAKLLAMLGAGD